MCIVVGMIVVFVRLVMLVVFDIVCVCFACRV